jgi:hypothetical protein
MAEPARWQKTLSPGGNVSCAHLLLLLLLLLLQLLFH